MRGDPVTVTASPKNLLLSHTEEKRALTGAWCTPELQAAVAKGYIILKVHKVWHFPEQRRDLFMNYIHTFLKIKQGASGWPADVGKDPEKRRAYVDA